MKRYLLLMLLLLCATIGFAQTAVPIANAGSTGTTLNTLTKLTGAPSTAVIAATTDTSGIIGICAAGCGTAGTAAIVSWGIQPCVFDNSQVAGDYVQISGSVAGNCHDSGASRPSSGQIIGRVLTTGGAGTANVNLNAAETIPGSGSSGLSGMTTGQVPIAAGATTVTSSEAIAGAGAAIVSGPTTSVNNDVVSYTGTAGQTQDSGVSALNLISAASAATLAKQLCVASGASRSCSYIDFPDVKVVPAANCVNATAGSGWDLPATNAPTAACRAGTNNLDGVLQWANNNTTTNAQFSLELPLDWDTTAQPYISIYYGSATNTTGTVKWTVSSACTKADGSITDDPAFVAETTTTGKTMAVANRMWAETLQFANITSGNNCIGGSHIAVKITSGNGTATGTVNVSKVVITIPRLLTVQAN